MEYLTFEYCPTCGNLIEKINDHHVPLTCCGQPLETLNPNSTDAAIEKHQPIFHINNTTLTVDVAKVLHPMTATHWIPWVIIQTPTMVIRQMFEAGEAPTLTIPCPEAGTPIRAYAYCNLHGLWVTDFVY